MKFDRNKKIDIFKPSETSNSFGEQDDPTDKFLTDIWASIVPSSGKEFFVSEQMQSEITTKVGTEYFVGIAENMIVSYGDRKFEIMYIINPKEQNRELILMCKELF